MRNKNQRNQKNDQNTESVVAGVNAVEAVLNKSPGLVNRVLLLANSGSRRLHVLQNAIKKLKIHTQQVDEKVLLKYHENHQGVVALLHQRELKLWEQLREEVIDMPDCVLVVPSNVEDPRNLGACIRSSVALGVHAMLLPKKGGCGLTAAVGKTAAGSLEKLPICRPAVLENAIKDLKYGGFTIYALEDTAEAVPISEMPKSNKVVWITGGEDKGVPPYLMKLADHVVKLPMNPEAHSYNTSVALSLALYEQQRKDDFSKLS